MRWASGERARPQSPGSAPCCRVSKSHTNPSGEKSHLPVTTATRAPPPAPTARVPPRTTPGALRDAAPPAGTRSVEGSRRPHCADAETEARRWRRRALNPGPGRRSPACAGLPPNPRAAIPPIPVRVEFPHGRDGEQRPGGAEIRAPPSHLRHPETAPPRRAAPAPRRTLRQPLPVPHLLATAASKRVVSWS